MLLKNSYIFLQKYKTSFLGSLLMVSIVLTFCMNNCYFFVGELPLSCGMFCFGCYYLILRYIASSKIGYARQLAITSMGVALLLLIIGKGIMKIPMAPSSIASHLLWQSRIPRWLLFYQLLLWVSTLSPFNFPKGKKVEETKISRLAAATQLVHLSWSVTRLFAAILLLLLHPVKWVPKEELYLMIGSLASFELIVLLGEVAIHLLHLKKEKLLPTSQSSLDQISYHFFLLLFIGVCLITNLLVVKHIAIGGYICTAGVLTYPITFLLIDVITELYGPQKAKQAIWAGFFSDMALLVGVSLTALLPITSDKKLFWDTFGFVSASLVASMIAYIIAQFIGIYLFCKLKKITKGSYLWLRNNVTTIISQGADTLIFALIAWAIWYWLPNAEVSNFSFGQWMKIAFNEYIVKIILALLDTPILYLIIKILKSIGIRGAKNE